MASLPAWKTALVSTEHLSKLGGDDLKNLCGELGKIKSGTKPELVARLREAGARYEALGNARLQTILSSLGMPVSGRQEDLIKRLTGDAAAPVIELPEWALAKASAEHLDALTVENLKDVCKSVPLTVGGRKAELIARLCIWRNLQATGQRSPQNYP